MTINLPINRDTIAMHCRLFYFADDSHDDPCAMIPPMTDLAFADMTLAEMRDDIDAFISIYMLDDLSDADIESAHRTFCDIIHAEFDYFADLIHELLESYRS